MKLRTRYAGLIVASALVAAVLPMPFASAHVCQQEVINPSCDPYNCPNDGQIHDHQAAGHQCYAIPGNGGPIGNNWDLRGFLAELFSKFPVTPLRL
jgi:hypothetical protein